MPLSYLAPSWHNLARVSVRKVSAILLDHLSFSTVQTTLKGTQWLDTIVPHVPQSTRG